MPKMSRRHKTNADSNNMNHHERFEEEHIRSGRVMMEHIKEVDWEEAGHEDSARIIDMSQDPDCKKEEWQ